VKAYEQGIADGSLAALARQYADGIVNLTVGNIRPGETVTVLLEILAGVEPRDDGFRFRFPFTLAPAYHSKMRTALVEGEGELELPPEFGDVILPPFRRDAKGLHEVGFDLAIADAARVAEIASPSHPIRAGRGSAALAAARDVPNRDLVLDVRFEDNAIRVLSGPDSTGKRSFAAVVPSTSFGPNHETPRRVAFLLDRSGSMSGEPLAQARKAIEACLAAMSEDDAFLPIAFDDRVELMAPAAVRATRKERDRARKFLQRIEARGGTELAAGVAEAARAIGTGGDILILTDGQVFGSEQILAQARAAGLRLFCLGIGSASQDRFLTLLARETGGIARFVTPRERVDLAAVDLFASIGCPVASGLKAGSNVQPEPPGAVFSGSPVLLYGEGERAELEWEGGSRAIEIPDGDRDTGETVRLLRGSRLITDWEARYPAAEATAALERRRQSRVAGRLAELSRTYGLASREMSLVAVVKRAGDRPGELPETRVVPVGMPQGVAFEAYFAVKPCAAPMLSAPSTMRFGLFASAPHEPATAPSKLKPTPKLERPDDDDLVNLAAMLEPDGGMPGDTPAARAARTVAAIFAFAAEGHTLGSGPFRLHLRRLIDYLKAVVPQSDAQKRALAAALAGKAPKGEWVRLARQNRTRWSDIEALV
jgi:Ca-activated chloride channel family protein